jgi:hypothetical protein
MEIAKKTHTLRQQQQWWPFKISTQLTTPIAENFVSGL